MQIIVLGMHRSGTSLITRLINMMGAYFAPEKASLGFKQDNPKGYWERRDALLLNDALLKHNGCTWERLADWPEHHNPARPEMEVALRSLILDMDAHRPWVLKDPRLCLTFPYWKQHLEVPVAVIVHRCPHEIARSLEKRHGIPSDYVLALWEYHAVYALNTTMDIPRVHVRHADAIRDPVGFVRTLKAALERYDVRGLREPSAREILAFVDANLHRAKVEPGLPLTPHQQGLDALVAEQVMQTEPIAISEEGKTRMWKGF